MANLGPWAVAICIKHLFDQIDAQAGNDASKDFLGTAFAMLTYAYGKHQGDLTDEQILRTIKLARLKIKVEASGEVSVAAIKKEIEGIFIKPRPVRDRSLRPIKPVFIERKQNSTVYHIQNLNVYLTAEVVHQLNMNPGQVINMVQENLEKEVLLTK